MAKAICPHCGKETRMPKAALFDEVLMGREECERCGQEFLIVDDAPITHEQYREKLIPPQQGPGKS
jgi:uncharacterized protein (DUF983 family)